MFGKSGPRLVGAVVLCSSLHWRRRSSTASTRFCSFGTGAATAILVCRRLRRPPAPPVVLCLLRLISKRSIRVRRCLVWAAMLNITERYACQCHCAMHVQFTILVCSNHFFSVQSRSLTTQHLLAQGISPFARCIQWRI